MCDDNNTSTLDGGHRMTRRGAIGAGAAGNTKSYNRTVHIHSARS